MKTLLTLNAKNHQPFKALYLLLIVLALVTAVGNLVMTYIGGEMGQAAADARPDAIFTFIALFSAVTAVRAIASAASVIMIGRYIGRASYRFRENFVRHFLRVPFADFEAKNSGEMLSVYTTDLPQAVELGRVVLKLISDIITVVATLAFMLWLHWLFSLIFFGTFPVLIVLQVLVSKPIEKLSVTRSEHRAKFNSVVNDSLQNTTSVMAYDLPDVMERRYMDAFDMYFEVTKKYLRVAMLLLLTGIFATMLPMVVLFILTANAVVSGDMSIAEFLALNMVAGSASEWLMMLSQSMGSLGLAKGGTQRLLDNTSGEPEDTSAVVSSLDGIKDGDVLFSFDNVSFAYGTALENGAEAAEAGTATKALDNVTFSVRRGERVALVGESGSGKSTALKLMLGLYTPDAGKLTFACQTNLAKLRQHVAYVPQNSFLFPESIRDNITSVRSDRPADALLDACRRAGILDFIESLPEGFDTVLAESADNVSGGQRQRIALARAFYQDAPVVLLDEATSALDTATQAQVLESIEALMQGRTVVMVAHRAAAITSCERIIRFDGGKILPHSPDGERGSQTAAEEGR